MSHAIIDLETLDTPTPNNYGCAVLSIGVVKFNPRTGLGDRFYRRLGYDQASLFGAVSSSTLAFWAKQDPIVRAEAFTAEHDIYQSAADLVQFMSGVTRVWGNGATFDIPIIEHWLQALGQRIPWKFSAARDCRTIEDIAADIGVVRKSFIRRGAHHNALDDAIYQAEYVCGMWQALTQRAVKV